MSKVRARPASPPRSKVSERLQQRAATLEAAGADPRRVELLHRARRFKRSWIEVAEALMEVSITRVYEDWGFADVYDYCTKELFIQRRTAEKLMGSYATVQAHAPEVLDPSEDRHVPTVDAVDYFARAVSEREVHAPRPPEVMKALHQAVFEEARPVSALRREFNPVLYARSPDQDALAALERAAQAAQRLSHLLPTLEGLRRQRVAEAVGLLEGLARELGELIPAARARIDAARAPSSRSDGRTERVARAGA